MLTSRKSEVNRSEILAHAKTLILERGFNSVTLQELLTAADITKGKFFHYFSSKDECFAEVLKQTFSDREFLRYEELLKSAPSPQPYESLLFLMDRAIEWHSGGLPSSMRLCVLATYFFPRTSPELVRARSLLIANMKVIEMLVRASQDSGDLPKTIDAKAFSHLFPGSAVGGNIIGFLAEGKSRSVENLRELRKLIVGLRQPNADLRSQ